MKRAIREHAGDFAAILGLFIVATAVSLYILENQRMRFPIIEEKPINLKGEF